MPTPVQTVKSTRSPSCLANADEPTSFVQTFLDQIVQQSSGLDGIMAAWPKLVELALNLARTSSDGEWREIMRNHAVGQIAMQDPMTAWSCSQPRGYPGDARLLDFIYGHPSIQLSLNAATPVGRDVHTFTYGADTGVAVRERRRLLARSIDETVERVCKPDVLAVACGHLREVELAQRITEVGRLVALDQDSESLAELRSSYPHLSCVVETVQKSVGRLAVRPLILGRFDLIYAAGLYDYLNESAAVQLTVALFSALKSGGRLLFANFAVGIKAEGYMDAFMDWRLVLREHAELHRLLDALPQDEVQRTRLFRSHNGAVIYVVVVRR